jgi:hypothetical protein
VPAKAQWLLQIPKIVEQLRCMDVPVVDRAGCEQLFHVGRRRAIELMHDFDGYQSGNTVLLDRQDLIQRLELLDAGPEVCWERQRKIRLSEQLRTWDRHRTAASVTIPVNAAIAPTLPAGLSFAAGRMTLEFGSVEDLLAKLYALAQAAGEDFDLFRTVVDGSGKRL